MKAAEKEKQLHDALNDKTKELKLHEKSLAKAGANRRNVLKKIEMT